MRYLKPLGLGLLMAVSLTACDLQLETDDEASVNPNNEGLSELFNIEVCADMTLRDLMTADELSEDCRDKVQSYLPQPESDLKDRLFAVGDVFEDEVATVYLTGADDNGVALTTEALSEVTVSVVRDGVESTIDAADIVVEAVGELDADLISISVTNDYSASMRPDDIDVVAQIESDIFRALPPVFETEIINFSELPTLVQAFTTERSLVLTAVARDDNFERKSTALYDAFGQSIESLIARDRPVKIAILSTDGRENASTTRTKSSILNMLTKHRVFVIALAALFADKDELRDFTQHRGIFIYTRAYSALREATEQLGSAVGNMVRIEIQGQYGDVDKLVLTIGDRQIEVIPPTPDEE